MPQNIIVGMRRRNLKREDDIVSHARCYGVTNMVVAGIEGSAPLAHPIKFHAQLTPIPVTVQERMIPLNFVDAAYRAAMVKARAYLRLLDQTVSDK